MSQSPEFSSLERERSKLKDNRAHELDEKRGLHDSTSREREFDGFIRIGVGPYKEGNFFPDKHRAES